MLEDENSEGNEKEKYIGLADFEADGDEQVRAV